MGSSFPSSNVPTAITSPCFFFSLAESGMIYRDRRLIHLRGRSLRDSIREIRRDANRIFDELESVADEIDGIIGISGKSEEKSLVIRMKSGIMVQK